MKKNAAAAEQKAAEEAEKNKGEVHQDASGICAEVPEEKEAKANKVDQMKKNAAAEQKAAEEAEKNKGEAQQDGSGCGAEVPEEKEAQANKVRKRQKTTGATEATTERKPEKKNKADKVKLDKAAVVAALRVQHERSINQFLFRAPPPFRGGPGSRAFRYEKGSTESMEKARCDCLQYLRDQCTAMGQEVPVRFR